MTFPLRMTILVRRLLMRRATSARWLQMEWSKWTGSTSSVPPLHGLFRIFSTYSRAVRAADLSGSEKYNDAWEPQLTWLRVYSHQRRVRQRFPFKCIGFWYIRSRISAAEKTRVFGVNSPLSRKYTEAAQAFTTLFVDGRLYFISLIR